MFQHFNNSLHNSASLYLKIVIISSSTFLNFKDLTHYNGGTYIITFFIMNKFQEKLSKNGKICRKQDYLKIDFNHLVITPSVNLLKTKQNFNL